MDQLTISKGQGNHQVPAVWRGQLQTIDAMRGAISFHWDAPSNGADRYVLTLSGAGEDGEVWDTCVTTGHFAELVYPRGNGHGLSKAQLKIESLVGDSNSFIVTEDVDKG